MSNIMRYFIKRLLSVVLVLLLAAPAFAELDMVINPESGMLDYIGMEDFDVQDSVPSDAADTGTAGTIAYDNDYLYLCTDTDTWRRVAIATWTVGALLLDDGTSYIVLDDGTSKILTR